MQLKSMLIALVLVMPLLTVPGFAVPAPASESVLGRWMTQDGAAIVRIGHCGKTVCGVADRVLDPKAPAHDINNPDPNLRGRMIVGSMVLTGFRPDGDGWSGGLAYSPKVGRTFRSSLKVMPDHRLRVTGCIFILCRSIYWKRVG
jgi:uncharacterized protein (DUF2147 family)